jgi:predicted enzyme related to lactoylglutathione lyase
MGVTETFFSVTVRDMERATAFYVKALGATVSYPSPRWSSLHIAGVRIGLFHDPEHAGGRTGLHFGVTDLAAALREIEGAGGQVISAPAEVAPGVIVADAADTEGNVFSLRAA